MPDLGGNLAVTIDQTGGASYQLANLHGDVVGTANTADTTPNSYFDNDEYGNPRSSTAHRYGWLGGKQRSTDALGGVLLMGVRLYNPTLGRFLQVDPVPGGSSNDYDYAGQDPINTFDLDGRCWVCSAWHSASHWVSHHKMDIALTVASFVVPEAAGAIWAYRAYRLTRLPG